jgi:hypothetical protein
MTKKLSLFLLALALAVPLVADAFPKKFTLVDPTDSETLLKTAKKVGMRLQGKPKGPAHKIAIAGFQVRYTFDAPEAIKNTKVLGTTTMITYRWARMQASPEGYRVLTDRLHEEFVDFLTKQGFEVVDAAAVLGSQAYAGIRAGDEKEKAEWARYAPTGFNLLPMYAGRPVTDHHDVAALNAELGTDAAIVVNVNVGLCNFDGTPKWRPGITADRVCLIGPNKLWESQIPALNIEWYGGAEADAKGTDEAWHARLYKYHGTWEDKKTGAMYDPPVVLSDAEVAAYAPSARTDGLDGELAAYAVATEATFDRGLQALFAVWHDKAGQ